MTHLSGGLLCILISGTKRQPVLRAPVLNEVMQVYDSVNNEDNISQAYLLNFVII